GRRPAVRPYPQKAAVRAAVIPARLDELLAYARELLERPDPRAAFEEFVWTAAEAVRRDRALFEGNEECVTFEQAAGAKKELHEAVDNLIRRPQRAGTLGRGVDWRDVGALVGAAIQASMHAERDDAWRRYVQVVLDGLRA